MGMVKQKTLSEARGVGSLGPSHENLMQAPGKNDFEGKK